MIDDLQLFASIGTHITCKSRKKYLSLHKNACCIHPRQN